MRHPLQNEHLPPKLLPPMKGSSNNISTFMLRIPTTVPTLPNGG